MKLIKIISPVLAWMLSACGPNVGMESAGAGGDAGVEDDEGELDEVERASWALGFFHYESFEPGTRTNALRMYELREDGTGIQHGEGCFVGVVDSYEPFQWRLIDDETIELFSPDGESVNWIRGRYETVELKRLGDGHVYQQTSQTNRVEFVRGKLCVTEHVEGSNKEEECENFGFRVGLCEEQ